MYSSHLPAFKRRPFLPSHPHAYEQGARVRLLVSFQELTCQLWCQKDLQLCILCRRCPNLSPETFPRERWLVDLPPNLLDRIEFECRQLRDAVSEAQRQPCSLALHREGAYLLPWGMLGAFQH